MSLQTDLILGKGVVVTVGSGSPVSTLGHIKIDNRCEEGTIQASNLLGGVTRPNGIRFLDGYFWAYGDSPPVFPNQYFDLQFTLNGGAAVQVANAGSGVFCKGVEVFVEPYDEEKKNVCYYVVHFGGAGVDFSTLGSPPADSTTPLLLSTKSLGLVYGGTFSGGSACTVSGGTTLSYIEGMHFKAMALSDPTWNSSTNGLGFYPVGDIDWQFEFTQSINQWQMGTIGSYVYPDLDAVQSLYMMTRLNSSGAPTNGWGLEYGMLEQKGGLFDHKTKKVLGMQFRLAKCNSGSKLGSITNPTGATLWSTIGA